MAYNDDMTWTDLAKLASAGAEVVKNALLHGKDMYDEWQSFRAGRTNTQLAAVLLKTEAQIADMDACFAAFSDLHGCANNVVTPQGDRLYAMRKFS